MTDKLISKDDLARKFDHTNLQQEATESDIALLCKEAAASGFFTVCVNPSYVRMVRDLFGKTSGKVCTVVGFPLGANTTGTKLAETEEALHDGADEIDVVMNVGLFKSGNIAEVETELQQVASSIQSAGADKVCKVIVEA